MNTTMLVLLCLFLLIIGASLFCGCCTFPIFVPLTNLLHSITGVKEGVGAPGSQESVNTANNDIAEIKKKQNIIPDVVTSAAASLSSGMPEAREGFISNGVSTLGAPLDEKNNGDVASSWVSKATTYASEFGYGDINNTGTAYTGTPIPLPEGELVIFAQNKFKPECCPSPYSSSTGCACITPEQYNYLNTRGGNRTSDSGV
jgi:hypothetical protein